MIIPPEASGVLPKGWRRHAEELGRAGHRGARALPPPRAAVAVERRRRRAALLPQHPHRHLRRGRHERAQRAAGKRSKTLQEKKGKMMIVQSNDNTARA